MKKAMRAAIGLAVSTAMTFGMAPSAHAFTAVSSNIFAPPARNTENANGDVSQVELEVFALVNQHRIAHGVAPLTMNESLNSGSKSWSYTMSRTGNFVHSSGGNYAENIYWASNIRPASLIFESWKNSPGHNRNMLDTRYSQIGVGVVYDSSGQTWATTQFYF